MFEHVRGASSLGGHFLLTQFADGEVVTHDRAARVFQVAEILPDRRRDVLSRRVELRRLDTPRRSESGDRFLACGKERPGVTLVSYTDSVRDVQLLRKIM